MRDLNLRPSEAHSLRETIVGIAQHWIVILISIVIVAAAASVAWLIRPDQYTATVELYVSAHAVDTPQAAYQGAQLSEQRVTSYVELITSTRVATEVGTELGNTIPPAELRERVSASSANNSVIIAIDAIGATPEDAVALANAVGSAFPRIVDELERPSSPAGIAPVSVKLVAPAQLPQSPSTLSLAGTISLAILAGLVLGVVIAAAINAADSRISSIQQLSQIVSAPPLGSVSAHSSAEAGPLITHDDPQSHHAEEYRQIRTALQYIDIDQPHKVLVFTSPNPQDGKTTTVANIAIVLAAAGHRVLLVDADLRRPRLTHILGLTSAVGVTTILSGQVRTGNAVQAWGGGLFDVLGSGAIPPNPSELLSSRQMKTLMDELRQRYDFVLLDAPPVLPVTDATAAAAHADGVILVSKCGSTRVPQIIEAASHLQAASARILGVILTMTQARSRKNYRSYTSHTTNSPIAHPTPVVSHEHAAIDRPATAPNDNSATNRIHRPDRRPI